jgi:hypothetical protein
MCARKAKKLIAELRSEGWKPGMDVRKTQTFEALSEACGCDTEGHAIEGAKRELHLGDDANGYNIRDLYENLVVTRSSGEPVGSTFVNDYMDPRHPRSIFEAGGSIAAVDSSAFADITGQLMVIEVLKPFQKEEYVASRMVPVYNSPFEQEKWIGLGNVADPGKNILRTAEGEPFKMLGFGQEAVHTPLTRKEGAIIGLTKEAVFFDRTGQITERAQQVGDLMALSQEKEILGVMIGGTTDPTYFIEQRAGDSAPLTLDLFQQAGATSGAYQLAYTYSTRAYPWVNDIMANPLHDYTSIIAADQYFANTVDPNTGEPIVVGKPFVFAPHTRRMNILRILQAENIFKMSIAGFTTAGAAMTQSPNVVNKIGLTEDQFVTSRQLKAQLVAQLGVSASAADDIWFYGDVAEAFRYVVNWPVTVQQAPVNSEAEFSQDIIMRWKASKRGRCAIRNPRCWQRHNYLGGTSAW